MFAPRGQLSFGDALSRWVTYAQTATNISCVFFLFLGPNRFLFIFICRCKMNNVPICLMYGKEDPWVKPVWGLQVKRQVPEAPYYEISPAGHCPHDEVPEVCSLALTSLGCS